MTHTTITAHARHRQSQRGVSDDAIAAALDYGTHVRARGADHYTIGWRDVQHLADVGIDISPYEGVTVVCASDGRVLTTYRKERRASLGRRSALGRVAA